MITMGQIMEQASKLKPLPQTACKLASLVSDEKSTIDEMVAVFEFDVVLTAEVLRYANSVMSASQKRVDTLKGAIIRMGAARILERIIAGHIQSEMAHPVDAYGLLSNELWRHSVASAVAAELLGAFTGMQIAGIAFTAALLHDIGKLLIGRVIGNSDLQMILENTGEDRDRAFEEIEQYRVGFSHAQIGAQLCGSWNLPDRITVAVRDHHRAGVLDDPVSDCVRLSNMTAKVIGEGIGFEGMAFSIDIEGAKRFGFTIESYEGFCANVKFKFNELMEMFSDTAQVD